MAEQQAKTLSQLKEARIAQDAGVATDDQILFINRERAALEAAQAKANRPGIFKRTKNWLFSGLSAEEQKGGRLGAGAAGGAIVSQTPKEEMLGEKEDRGVLQAVEDKVEANRRSGERLEETLRPLGGPLDRQAERAAAAVSDTGKHWTSWIRGS